MRLLIVSGNVGRDPELHANSAGKTFVTFSVAIYTPGRAPGQKADWIEVTCSDRTAEIAQKYVRKGMKVLIYGTPKWSAYTTRDGRPEASVRLFAHLLEMCSSKSESEQHNHDIGNRDMDLIEETVDDEQPF